MPGCSVGGLGAGGNGDQGTFVHEIVHGYGFQHTPCGNTGASDPSYPVYEQHPSASIGEYGLNIFAETPLEVAVLSPRAGEVTTARAGRRRRG